MFLLIALALLGASAFAEVVYRAPQPGSEIAELVGCDAAGTTVRFNLTALEADEALVPEFGSGSVFRVPSGGIFAEVGSPALPVIRRMVLVPNTGGVHLEVISEETSTLGFYDVAPFQPLPTRNGETFPYRINQEVYGSDEFNPGDAASIGSVEILRDIRVAWVEFYPVRYNPVTGEVLLTTSATVELTYGGPGENELLRPFHGYTRSFLPFYEEVLGFDGAGGNIVDGSFVFISTTGGFSEVQDLIDWKIQKGFEVELGTVPDIGSTGSAIDSWIENAYNTWPNPPEWIILVGGDDIVPTQLYGGAAADNLYGVVGSGSVPDIHVGRLSGNDTDDLSYQAWKIVEHEMNPYQPATSWFQNAISIGSTDFNDPEHSWEYAQIFMAAGMTVDYFCSEGGMNPTIAAIAASINAGRSLISYIGHGSYTYWVTSGFSNSDVAALTNGRMLPWINSIACQNGHFNDGYYCFAEAWMSEGSTSTPKGAIGIMAATTNSPVGPTDSLAEYTFRGYFEEDIWHMGAAVDYGKQKVYEFYGSGGDSNNNMHMVFGCPELDIYFDTSPILALNGSHSPTISLGTFTVTVTDDGKAPVEGALVAAAQDDELLDSDYTNSSGVVNLSISSFPYGTGVDVDVTATYHNMAPYLGTATPSTGVGEDESGPVPQLALMQASPNPFSSSTIIGYSVPGSGDVRLEVYDMSGRLVNRLEDSESAEAGEYSIEWDGRDASGSLVPDGVYLYRLTTSEGSLVRSLVLLR